MSQPCYVGPPLKVCHPDLCNRPRICTNKLVKWNDVVEQGESLYIYFYTYFQTELRFYLVTVEQWVYINCAAVSRALTKDRHNMMSLIVLTIFKGHKCRHIWFLSNFTQRNQRKLSKRFFVPFLRHFSLMVRSNCSLMLDSLL